MPCCHTGHADSGQEAPGKLNGKILNHPIRTFYLNPSVLKVALFLEQPQKLASMDHPHTVLLHAEKHHAESAHALSVATYKTQQQKETTCSLDTLFNSKVSKVCLRSPRDTELLASTYSFLPS